MPFLQVHLTLDDLDPEQAEQACFEAGASAVTLSDAGDAPILEPAPGATPLWPRVALAALFAADADPAALAAALRSALGRPTLGLRFEELGDRHWEREWLRDFRPMRFGRRLWICPGGQPPPEPASSAKAPGSGAASPTAAAVAAQPSAFTDADARTDRGRVIVWLDPGLAFGTGTHATTALCLEWLDGAALAGARVLDVGCGSGILAVAALALGAATAVGIDVDPQALLASGENAARNGVGDRLDLRPASAAWDGPYDVVLANILAEPLVELAPRVAAATRAGGSVVLSGVLAEQAGAVAAAYAPWFDMAPAQERDGWAGLSGRRRR